MANAAIKSDIQIGEPNAKSTISHALNARFGFTFSFTSLDKGISDMICDTISFTEPISATASSWDNPSSILSSIISL